MKTIIYAFLLWIALLSTCLTFAQDRYSIQITTDNVIFQKGLFYGGIEFNAEFNNHIYVRPQIHYADLKDGYLETSAGIGAHFDYNRWNYNAGVKIGVINRAATYPILGIEIGTAFKITDKIAIGLRASYDKRGDAKFYEGKDWVYNSQGFIKFEL